MLRDGTFVGQWPIEELDTKTVIEHMVGRTITEMFPKEESGARRRCDGGEGPLQKGQFENLNFKLRKGKYLDSQGSLAQDGRKWQTYCLAKSVRTAGEIILNGKSIAIKSQRRAGPAYGICAGGQEAVRPEPRGIHQGQHCRHAMGQHLKMGFVNKRKKNELGAAMVEKLGIKISSPNHPASSLSGGNQQKIVLAKWVSHDLDILILDEPTRGVDVGAKAEIHKIVVEFAKRALESY